MDLTITFQSATPRTRIALHAWEPLGHVWDIFAQPDSNGLFSFNLTGTTADQRTIRFKFRFPDERRWEPDDFVRRIPTRRIVHFWTYDYSSRVSTHAPYGKPAPSAIDFHLTSASQFADGQLYLWKPGADVHLYVPQKSRAGSVSTFHVPLAPWMSDGFHFKCVTPLGEFEPERLNRVWRPADGSNVYLKSGQVSLRGEPLELKPVTIDLLYPANLPAPPTLHITDGSQNFSQDLQPLSPPQLYTDPRFLRTAYSVDIYPRSPYTLSFNSPALGSTRPYQRPLRIDFDDTADQRRALAVFGYDGWFTAPPPPAPVKFVFHPQPGKAPLKSLNFHVGVGIAPPHETVAATKTPAGTWEAATTAFAGLPSYAIPEAQPPIDSHLASAASARRTFTATDPSLTVLHTANGQAGFVAEAAPPPPAPAVVPAPPAAPAPATPADPPVPRPALMVAAFSKKIIEAGVFDPSELPHGSTALGADVYFILYAPHAVTLSLILLSDANVRTSFPMQPTTDGRYWWCKRPAAQIPHGQRYRFLQNNDTEVLDPAAHWATNPVGELWANVGEGADRAWSLYVDRSLINAAFAGDNWNTLPWESMLVYQLHPLRFTVRNPGIADGFDQVAAELAPGKYLRNLGITELEFLPLHEFPLGSWGYNPSLFFAIKASYGGPLALAKCVAAAHAAGKGIIMDLVFNHVVDSPLQALANEVYVDGETAWGAQINYDNPRCMEFFRQVIVYLWDTFRTDGFRFDSTQAIVNGQWVTPGIIKTGGSGGGWNFLQYLRGALRKAADATGRHWPYCVGEHNPNDWALTNNSNGGVLDGQWDFTEMYPLGNSAWESGDNAPSVAGSLSVPYAWVRPFSEAVRYGESHDSCGHRDDSSLRIVRRAPFGQGFQMAKAVGATALLAMGIPMMFMGQEGGEDNDFFFDYDPATDRADLDYFARLDLYESLGDDHNRIFAWFRDLAGLRTDPSKDLTGNDNQIVGQGYRTVAFTRSNGRLFVAATFGTSDTRQTLGWLGLPGGASYKEIFNSSWPAYQVVGETNFSNGGYDANLDANSVVNLPPVGALVLERR